MSALRVFFLAFLGLIPTLSAQKNDLRDREALYLDHLPGTAPIVLKVNGPTAVYATRTLSAHIGNFVAGDEVILLAHHPDSYLVRAKRGKLEGWVPPKYLEEVDPSALKAVRDAIEEEQRYQEAVKKKEVIAGMTFDHVLKAMGKPDNKSFREDENGRFDLWSYIEYETVVEQRPYRDPLTGQLGMQSYRVKIPVGSLEVEFKQGRVSALERTQNNTSVRNNTRLR